MKTYLHIMNYTAGTNDEFLEDYYMQDGDSDISQIIIKTAARWNVKPENIRCFVYTKKIWDNMLAITRAAKTYSVEKYAFVLPKKYYWTMDNDKKDCSDRSKQTFLTEAGCYSDAVRAVLEFIRNNSPYDYFTDRDDKSAYNLVFQNNKIVCQDCYATYTWQILCEE